MKLCPRCQASLSEHITGGVCAACLLTEAFLLPPAMDAIDLFADMPEGEENFGRFILVEEVGRGGMGVVYRAKEKISGRIVALKMILPGYLRAPEVLRQFKTEIQAVGRLEHPNILSVYEIGEHDGLPFFSMRFAEGGNLAKRVLEFRDHPRAVAALVRKLALAMHHAHQRGVVHRDLKPGNILLDAEGEPLIGDFGIAKVLSAELDPGQTMMALGTPSYSAPELLLEGNAAVTTAVDIYGIGAIFYELLVGAPPYSGPTAGAILQQMNESPLTGVRTSGAAIDRELEAVVLKCLVREPAGRYESALALAQDLERWSEGYPVSARPVGSLGQFWRWAKRKPAIAALSAALAVFVVAGGIGSTIAAVRIARERDRAVQAETQGQRELFRALLAQAKASRHTGLAGQRFEGLEAIKQAAAIQVSDEARNEAAALLALADFRLEKEKRIANLPGKQMLIFDVKQERYALVLPEGDLSIRRAEDDYELVRLKNPGSAPAFFLSAFSNDGNFLVAYYGDALRVWDIAARKVIVEKPRPLMKTAVGAFWSGWGFRADSKRLALALVEGGYGIYSLPEGREVARIVAPPGAQMVRFNPAGDRLAYTRYRKSVEIRDPLTAEVTMTLETPDDVATMTWSPDGRVLAVGCYDDTITFWNVETGKPRRVLRGHRGSLTQMIFSRDGTLMASNAIDGTVRLWHVESGALLVTLPRYGTEPTMHFSEDNRRLLITEAGAALWFEVATGLTECALLLPPGGRDYVSSSVANSDFSPDGRWLAAATQRGIHVWNTRTRAHVTQLSIDPKQQDGKSLAFAEGGQALLVSSRESGVTRYAFDRPTGNLGNAEKIFTETEFDLNDASGDGKILALSSRLKAEIVFLSTVGAAPPMKISGQFGVWNVGISPDGRWAASNSFGEQGLETSDARAWDVATGRVVHAFGRGTRGEVEFSRDGQRLFVAGNQQMQTWQVSSWQAGATMPEPLRDAAMFGVSEDGELIGVLFEDRVWLLRNGDLKPLVVLEAPHETPHDGRVRFNADSSQLAMHYSDGTMLLWDLQLMQRKLSDLGLGWEK